MAKVLEKISELLKFPNLGNLAYFSVFVSLHPKNYYTHESYNLSKALKIKTNLKPCMVSRVAWKHAKIRFLGPG